MRTVILVELPWGRDKDPRVPLGHASLMAVLKMNEQLDCHSIVQPINEDKFDVGSVFEQILLIIDGKKHIDLDIAFGVYVWAEEAIQDLLQMLREFGFNGRIILGGPQISYCGAGLEELYPHADVFVRGYGEFAISGLAGSNTSIQMPGIHYAGELDQNTQTSVDLDLLPSPWLEGLINLENQEFIRWESQRGCPFKCGFCQHKEPGARLKKREFLPNRIMQEIDLFCTKDVKDIAVLDPIFNASSQSKNILKRFIFNNFQGRLSFQCRAEMTDEEFIQLASELNVCLEFGLQTIHKEEGRAVNRVNNMRKVVAVMSEIVNKNIECEVSLIFGLPCQTYESFCETVNWCLEMKLPTVKAFPLMLLRGTEIEKNRDTWGLIESGGSMPVVLQSDTFSYDDWVKMAQISEALKMTEGKHPDSISELLHLAEGLEIDLSRYRPDISVHQDDDEIQFRGGSLAPHLELYPLQFNSILS
mgnify:CR=1 FL=1